MVGAGAWAVGAGARAVGAGARAVAAGARAVGAEARVVGSVAARTAGAEARAVESGDMKYGLLLNLPKRLRCRKVGRCTVTGGAADVRQGICWRGACPLPDHIPMRCVLC